MCSYVLVLAVVFVCVFHLATTKENARTNRNKIDYCNLPAPMCQVTSPKNETLIHVMCKYPTPGPNQRCDHYRSRPIEGRLRARMLRRHNMMRSRVASGLEPPQPTAANMRQLSWSDQLASYAQRWVDQCVGLAETPHDTCRDTPTEWVGQNVGVVEHDGPYERYDEVDELVVDFFREMKDVSPKSLPRFNGDPLVVGHYIQLVWAETTRVGCARASYDVATARGKRRHTRLVCNYSPAGLIDNEPVYVIGPPGSQCPANTSRSPAYPGLCSTTAQNREPNHFSDKRLNLDITARSDKGIRFVVGNFVNGRCYCRGEKTARASLLVCLSMILLIIFSQMYYRKM